ncbi:MAG: hypothetical protein FWC34_11480 [Bacteroidetes bacterium]|nr:hypothetical protein [Bacteroidota bacterium]MCL2302203.1 hypothetical protein [Lentimicrobiaceae bacterium]MCL2302283.1 hypothetical protein [Lentimicrobiaceae bacterium]
MNIYYKIWVDNILRLRSQKQNKDTWQEWSMIIMTAAMTANFMLFMAIFERHILGFSFYEFNIVSPNVVPIEGANDFLNTLVLFVLPCFVINYLLIFRKKRLKKLIRKYKYPNYHGKLAATYVLISFLLPLVLIFGNIIIYQDVTFWDFFGR